MPAKARTAKKRRPSFDDETLELFVRLEATPRDRRGFRDGDRQLARRLGLMTEWWGGQSVLDRSDEPCHPPSCCAFGEWHRCRSVREALLAAVANRWNRV
jgi:hypothetical protein